MTQVTSKTEFNPMSLHGRTVLVTGASSGIGRATAIYASRLGAKVVICGRNAERLSAVLAELHGRDHVVQVFDLAKLDEIMLWLKSVCAEVGPLHGLAHCAAVQATRPIQAINPGFVEEILLQNLGAALMLAQAFRLKACHQPQASLVFVSSSAALRTAPGNVVYAASKGGIISAVKGLGVELVRDGVRVNAVAPAMVDTPMSAQFREILSEENFQKVIAMHPLGFGQPEDVAAAINFLLADTARWITGSVLCVDGGFLA
jgi:NAD(P)-dependent dehydrogenase (short-subunit alcohol dehydrogenase family)